MAPSTLRRRVDREDHHSHLANDEGWVNVGSGHDTGLQIQVCHLPPGTSKWNKIEHRLFSFISRNWRADPLVSLEAIVSLIAATTTRTGLEVYAQLDRGAYPDRIQVTDAGLAAVNLHRATFHPDWNYTIKPRIY